MNDAKPTCGFNEAKPYQPTGSEPTVRSTGLLGDLVLMVDVFCACIETGMLPKHGSPCHRKARKMVEASGQKPKRQRRRLSPNVEVSDRSERFAAPSGSPSSPNHGGLTT